MEKILTISIAGYNVEKYIRETLDSICVDDIMDNLEIFVVDDGGKDSTLEIAKEYEKRYPNSVHAIHKENGGWGSTVNYSIEHATGKYFRLLDGDDYFKTENISHFVNSLRKFDADVVYTPYRRFDDNSGKTVDRFDADKSIVRNSVISIENCNNVTFVMHAISFKTRILQENNVTILENCFYTDADYRTKGLAYCKTALFLTDEIYQYRVGRVGQSVDISGLKKHYKDSQRVVDELVNFSKSLCDNHNKELTMKYTKGSLMYQYDILIILGFQDEIREYDEKVKTYGKTFYETNDKTINYLRSNGFKQLRLIRAFRRIRSRIALWVKPLIHRPHML